jgi:cytochrome c peroxidase
MGETGKISCFSCHSGPYLDDQRSPAPRNVSLGAGFHTRNAPTTINSVFYQWTNWGGRFSAPWELPIAVVESPVIMNSSRLRLAHVIFDTYRTEYEAVFGAMEPAIGSDPVRFPASGKPAAAGAPPGAWEGMTDADRGVVNLVLANFGKAIEAYLRKLVSRNAPLDRFVAGDEDALDQSEKRGLRLFLGEARCFSCHSGPLLADNLFHNLGVPQTGERVPASDDGRFKDIPGLIASPFNSAGAFSDNTGTGRLNGVTNPPPESTRGQFRTPSLRGVALTAPYMHSGQLPTLEAVVAFYVAGGGTPVAGVRDAQMVPLDLDRRERRDLIAFLHALTGESVPAPLLVDTSK